VLRGGVPVPGSGMGYSMSTSNSCRQYVTRICFWSLNTTWSYGTRQEAGLYFRVYQALGGEQIGAVLGKTYSVE
jgi:hypothetical protein